MIIRERERAGEAREEARGERGSGEQSEGEDSEEGRDEGGWEAGPEKGACRVRGGGRAEAPGDQGGLHM